MAEDWVDKALREFQRSIVRGAYEGIYSLDEEHLDGVMVAQARSCVQAFVDLYGISEDMDLDEFLARMTLGGSSKITIRREGNTILWDEQHEGECMCPLVKQGIISLQPSLCNCAIHWLRMLVERHVDQPVRVELLDSVAQGSRNCTFRITVGA